MTFRVSCLVIVVAALLAPRTSSALLLDQSVNVSGGIMAVVLNEDARYYGQSFTAGISGQLVRADATVQDYWSQNLDFEFSIWSTSAGLPTGEPLAVQRVDAARIVGTVTQVVFDQPASIVAGQQYALLVRGANLPPEYTNHIGVWLGPMGDRYAGGTALEGNSPTTMSVIPANPSTGLHADLGFATYVQIPEPTALAPLLLGFATRTRRK
jgi:hypothetical protein